MNHDKYCNYKPIRNHIRKFKTESLVHLAINILNDPIMKSPNYLRESGLLPWELLLLIKWTLYEKNRSGDKNAIRIDLIKIINKIKKLDNDLSEEKENKYDIQKYMRKAAFQQFWFDWGQKKITVRLGRTIDLFLNMDIDFDLDNFLIQKIGINRQDFFDLAFITWIQLNSNNEGSKVLTIKHYSMIKDIEQYKVEKFFEAISLDWNNGQKFAEENMSKVPIKFQIFEETPLKRYPFLKTNEGLYCYSSLIFTDFVENYFYDFAKINTNGKFNEKFGYVFEAYVEKGLAEITNNFLKEDEIKNRFKNKKSVDYFIETSNGNLLIECKAIELSPLAKVSPTDESMEKSLRDSIIKSIIQSIDVIKAAKNSSEKLASDEYYVIVVTYKELYLGNGEIVWDEFLGDAVKRSYPEIDLSIIDPSKIFFCSIHDFDEITFLYKGRIKDFVQELSSIVNLKLKPEYRKYTFGMYFKNQIKNSPDRLEKIFSNYNVKWKNKIASK